MKQDIFKTIAAAVCATLLTISSSAVALAAPGASDDSVILTEEAQVDQAETNLRKRKAELEQTRDQAWRVERSLEKAKSSCVGNGVALVPFAVLTFFGSRFVRMAHTPGVGAGVAIARLFSAVFGYPMTIVGGVGSLYTGSNVYLRASEISELSEKLSPIKSQIQAELASIKEHQIELAGFKRSLCIVKGEMPETCAAAYAAEKKAINFVENK